MKDVFAGRAGLHKEVQRDRYAPTDEKHHGGDAAVPMVVCAAAIHLHRAPSARMLRAVSPSRPKPETSSLSWFGCAPQIYGRDLDEYGAGYWAKVKDSIYKGRAGFHPQKVQEMRYADLGPKKEHLGNATCPKLVRPSTTTAAIGHQSGAQQRINDSESLVRI